MPSIQQLLISTVLILMLGGCGQDTASNDSAKAETGLSSNTSLDEPAAEPEGALEPNNEQPTAMAEPQPHESAVAAASDRYADIDLTVAAIREATYDDGSTIEIRFSVPLDRSKSFSEFISVSENRDAAWIMSADGKSLYMTGAEPETAYNVSVQPGLYAASGKRLGQSHTATVTTASAQPVLSFASDGHVLVPGSEQGLPVITRNINEVNVSFLRVEDDNIARAIQQLGNGTRSSNYYLDTISQYSTLAYEGRFELTSEKNRRRQVNLPIHNIEQLQLPGLYVAVMDEPASFHYEHPTTWFTVSDLGLHLRKNNRGADLFVQSLSTTHPIQNARIEKLRTNGSRTQMGTTDAEGHFRINQRLSPNDLLIVRKNDSVSVLPLNTTALDLSAFHHSTRPYRVQNLFIYGPRDLYRGGETAQFSALLRGDDGQPVKSTSLRADVIRPDGQTATTLTLKPQSGGYYEWQYSIAEDAMTGNWRIEIELADRNTAVYQFKVEDFMPERMKMTWHPHDQQAANADTAGGKSDGQTTADNLHIGSSDIRVAVLGEYLYGAPAAGNRFDVSVSVRPQPHPFEQWPDYWFGNTNITEWNRQEQQELVMDADGKAVVEIANQWTAAQIPLAINLVGSLFESGGRPVIRRQQEVWLPGKPLAGIKPAFKDHAPVDGLADFDVILTDGSKQLFARRNVDVSLLNVTPRYHWRYSSSRGWYNEREEQSVKELSMSIDLNGDQPTRIQVPVGRGEYQLLLTDPETGMHAMVPFNAGDRSSWWYSRSDNSNAQPQQVTLAWDKPSYRTGDVATLAITPPAAVEQLPQANHDALVMVEGSDIKFIKRVSLPKSGGKVDIPIEDSWNQHNLYASVLYLQPSDNQQRITPTRSIGLIHLPLDRSQRALNIGLDAPRKWLPNRTVNLDMTVTDSAGEAVNSAWVTLAAVDVGVLSVSGFATPNPFDFFFEPRRYEIDQYDLYHQLIDFNSSKPATLKFGGDAPMARGGDMARSNVQIVSLYSGRVAVSNGKASIPLQLPDFNGRVRLMAVAFDDQRFGQTDAEVTIAAPLVTQMSLPRFAGINDQSTIALDLTNLSGDAATLTLRASASGPVEFENVSRNIALANKAKTTIQLPFSATMPASGTLGMIDFHVQVEGIDEYPVDRHWQLTSRPTLAAVTERYRDRLSAGESLSIDPESLNQWADMGLKGQLILDPRVNLNPANQLDQLLHYPYGCLEQSVSSSWPWLFVDQHRIDELNQRSQSEFQRQQALEDGLNRIYKRQLTNGGFTLWSLSDDYEQHWLTAYAADFLSTAADQGYNINQKALDKAIGRLQQYVRGRATNRERWSAIPDAYRFAYRAYSAYVLARHRQISLANIRRLATAVPQDATRLALTQLAEAARLMGDQRQADELLELARTTERSQQYIGDYGSAIRDKAAVVNLLANSNNRMANEWRDDLLFELESDLRNRRWLSTQERIQLLLASDTQADTPSPWQASLTFMNPSDSTTTDAAETRQLSGDQTQRQPLDSGQLQQRPQVTNTGNQSVSAELVVQGYLQNNAPRNSGNVSIQRRYYQPDGTPVEWQDEQLTLNVGDRVLVELFVESDKYRPDLLAVDLLPAGLELENDNLEHGSAGLVGNTVMVDDTPITEWNNAAGLLHEEFRDDRFVAALAIGNDYGYQRNARMFYFARAVTPGHYRIPGALLEDMYDPEARSIDISTRTLVIEP